MRQLIEKKIEANTIKISPFLVPKWSVCCGFECKRDLTRVLINFGRIFSNNNGGSSR